MNRNLKFLLLALSTSLPLLVTSCFRNNEPHHTSAVKELEDPWKKRWWLGKLSRALRYGQGITTSDKVDELLKKTPDEIVEHFMNDPRFERTVLDFTLYLLGARLEQFLGGSQGSDDDVGANAAPNEILWGRLSLMRPAVSGARALMSDGDFNSFYAYHQPLYTTPNDAPRLTLDDDGDTAPPRPGMSKAQIRTLLVSRLGREIDTLIGDYKEDKLDKKTLCERLRGLDILRDLGTSRSLREATQLSPNWGIALFIDCDLPVTGIQVDVVAELERLRKNVQTVLAQLPQFDPEVYKLERVTEYKTMDAETLGLKEDSVFFGENFFRALPNSSTNYNRKRAAYMLKHFFCDDLTPLAVELPSDHSGDAHASEPGCQSCHYKLDPMAGFFRARGLAGISFSNFPSILFDDLASAERAKYDSAWKAKEGSGREWEIGYIRSTKEAKRNSYGDSPEHLGAILGTAPEVKQCLIRRTFEFFVAENQAVDAGFLDYLTKKYIEESKESSGRALKNVIKKVLTSNTFAQQDPVEGECYDAAPGSDVSNKPPCQVAFLLERNCKKCHDGASGEPEANLSLTEWIKFDDGTFGFPHKDDSGAQIARKETFQRMMTRLSTSDPKLKMPRGFITAQDRQVLVLWLDKQLKQ